MHRNLPPRDPALEKLCDDRDHALVQISLLQDANEPTGNKVAELRTWVRDLEAQIDERERLNRAFRSFGNLG